MALASTFRRLPIVTSLIRGAVALESWWFDFRHGIQTRTAGDDPPPTPDQAGNFWYIPTRPAAARHLLRSLPIQEPSAFTFVDVGSGKGRMLLLASEFGFGKVLGIELRSELHRQAIRNVDAWQRRHPQFSPIACVNDNAMNYAWPDENLVVYFFNPFKPELMNHVLNRLASTLEKFQRDAVLVLVYFERNNTVPGLQQFRLIHETKLCRIYRRVGDRTTETTIGEKLEF